MARKARLEGDKYNAHVVGWEGRNGRYHTVRNQDDKKVGRNPSARQLEMADRVIIRTSDGPSGKEFFSVPGLTDDYGIDEAMDELIDFYKKKK